MTEEIVLQQKRIDIKYIKEAKAMNLSTNKYIGFLKEVIANNKTISEEQLNKTIQRQEERIQRLEGLLETLIVSLSNKDISERSLVMLLQKDHQQLMLENKELRELILSNFSFIDAFKKVVSE